MIALLRRRPPAALLPLPLHLPLLVVAVSALAMLCGADARGVTCALALAASLFAAVERRSGAMLAATGIAIGLAPGGLILAPMMVGLAIQRRAATRLLLIPLTAIPTWFAIADWGRIAALPSLYDLTLTHPDLRALILATGIGLAAWTAAAISARPMGGDRLLATAMVTGLAAALIIPTPAAALALPIILILRSVAYLGAVHRAANDNAPIRRPIRLAA